MADFKLVSKRGVERKRGYRILSLKIKHSNNAQILQVLRYDVKGHPAVLHLLSSLIK